MNKAILLFLILFLQFAKAQTSNDNMADAELLKLNQFVNSKTHGNTVEWECVDESLTGKCIDYHNDQWFRFYTGTLGRVFINISGQHCRDMRGVQLVFFKGDTCQPETYDILGCISLATQDDIYISFNVERDTYYWLNVDGYLHDFCEFFLEISDHPKGTSHELFALTKSEITKRKNIVQLKWQVPDSLKYKVIATHIFRKTAEDFKFLTIDSVALNLNAFGEMHNEYSFSDTLIFPGDYQYQLAFDFQNGEKKLFAEYNANINGPYRSEAADLITLELEFDQRSQLMIEFKDANNGEVLHSKTVNHYPGKINYFSFYSNAFNTENLEVLVTHERTGYQRSYFYRLK